MKQEEKKPSIREREKDDFRNIETLGSKKSVIAERGRLRALSSIVSKRHLTCAAQLFRESCRVKVKQRCLY